ncbi:hypothetical protein [Sinomonas soli]
MTTSREGFSVKFDGPALEDHAMRVEDLAPALLAMARLFRDAQTALGDDAPPASLDIHAQRPGSFAVDLMLEIPGIYEQVLGMLLSREAQATLSATGLLGVVLAAFRGLKWMHGRHGLRREHIEPGQVRITDANGDSITLPAESLSVIQSPAFRRAAEEMTRPLERDGIDSIVLTSSADPQPVVVSQEDRESFEVPDQEEVVFEPTEREVVVRLENVAFVEGNKWKVNDGANSFHAAVEDLGFRERVESGAERFAANDTLKVLLRTQQRKTKRGALQVTNTILRVLDHQHGPQQIPLPFEDEGPASA